MTSYCTWHAWMHSECAMRIELSGLSRQTGERNTTTDDLDFFRLSEKQVGPDAKYQKKIANHYAQSFH